MRILGVLLVSVGSLVLAYQGFRLMMRDTVFSGTSVSAWSNRLSHRTWLVPAIGASAIGSGMLLIRASRSQEYD